MASRLSTATRRGGPPSTRSQSSSKAGSTRRSGVTRCCDQRVVRRCWQTALASGLVTLSLTTPPTFMCSARRRRRARQLLLLILPCLRTALTPPCACSLPRAACSLAARARFSLRSSNDVNGSPSTSATSDTRKRERSDGTATTTALLARVASCRDEMAVSQHNSWSYLLYSMANSWFLRNLVLTVSSGGFNSNLNRCNHLQFEFCLLFSLEVGHAISYAACFLFAACVTAVCMRMRKSLALRTWWSSNAHLS
mmetsp:Transcript_5044/g.11017  ORF Transcript_5044/g.11017 Transcript_5044/m.11017 type:complete len:253 (+) Transcript_5044:1223-1981(+)